MDRPSNWRPGCKRFVSQNPACDLTTHGRAFRNRHGANWHKKRGVHSEAHDVFTFSKKICCDERFCEICGKYSMLHISVVRKDAMTNNLTNLDPELMLLVRSDWFMVLVQRPAQDFIRPGGPDLDQPPPCDHCHHVLQSEFNISAPIFRKMSVFYAIRPCRVRVESWDGFAGWRRFAPSAIIFYINSINQ